MYAQIFVLILVLGALVAAYFSSKTWGWGHVSLVLALFFATLGFTVLAARVMNIHQTYRSQVQQREAELEKVQTRMAALEHGTSDPQVISQLMASDIGIDDEAEEIPGVRQLRHEMHLITRDRGRVWRDVVPMRVDQQTGAVRVGMEAPTPPGVDPNAILYVFEQGPPAAPDPRRGAQYLGEFRVTEVAGQELTLDPVEALENLSQYEKQRYASSRGPWVLYEMMPNDQRDLFAHLTPEQIKQMFPPETAQELLREGSRWTADDGEWTRAGYDADGNRVLPDEIDRAVTSRYERPLRDFAYAFQSLLKDRATLLARVGALQQDNERVNQSLASAKELQANREEEKQKLAHDLAGVTKERQFIENLLTQVQQMVNNAREGLAAVQAENMRMIEELAREQQNSASLNNLTSQ